MIRRLLLAALITLTPLSAYAEDCQPYSQAYQTSQRIAAKGAYMTELNRLSVNAFLKHLRDNGAPVPPSLTPDSAIVLRANTVTLFAMVTNGQVCTTLFVPTPVYDAYFGRKA